MTSRAKKGWAEKINSSLSPQIVSIGQQVGESYSEEVDSANLVTKRNYGAGQLIRTITDSEVTDFQLVFSIPRLFCTGVEGIARGQLFPANIRFQVSVQSKGGGFVDKNFNSEGSLPSGEILDGNVISGISANGYQLKSKPIALEGSAPWNYLITRKSSNLNYRNSACVALSISSEQYNSLPARAYDVKGKKVKIPSNAVVREDGSLEFISDVPFDGQLKEGLY